MSTQETPCAGDEDFADSIRPSESFSCEDADTETICSISKDCDITQGHFTEDFDSTNETASMRHSADDGEASLRKQDTTMISAASNEVLALDTFATMTSNTRPVMMELPKQLPVMLLTQRDELALARADDLARNYLNARRSHFRILLRQVTGLLALEVVAATALLAGGGWLVLNQQLTIGQLVAADGNEVVVASGLAPGMQVVVAGVHVLTEGQKVSLYPSAAGTAADGSPSASAAPGR